MSKKDKPLPKPPQTPFEKKRRFESSGESETLVSDKMSMAMAEGKLDEFMNDEFKDNEGARKLADMMMGMSGMAGMASMGGMSGMDGMAGMMGGASAKQTPQEPAPSETATTEPTTAEPTATDEHDQVTPPTGPPDEALVKAVMDGDVNTLTAMLQKEHSKRTGEPIASTESSNVKQDDLPKDDYTLSEESSISPSSMEKEVIVKLMKIAQENEVSVDWVINRALKLYVRDYEGTGRV